jgi:hypothetical protein
VTNHPLDSALAPGQLLHAPEADPHLAVRLESKQARLHGPIAAAPTPRLVDEVASDGGSLHG